MEMPPLSQLMNLSGKVAVVTGGAMGIGEGIAYRLAEAGADVVAADMNAAAAEAAAARLVERGWKASGISLDVADGAAIARVFDEIAAQRGGIDILVNNAGIYPSAPLMQMADADIQRIFAVNLTGAMHCAKAAAAAMIAQGRGGRIINITSIDAVHPSMVGLAAYDASKHGLWGFTKNAALELAAHKIWVNAIAPGGITTPGTGGGVPDAFLAKIPMHRMGEPDDIGKVALFLASDLASYMTGSQIIVDGGYLLG